MQKMWHEEDFAIFSYPPFIPVALCSCLSRSLSVWLVGDASRREYEGVWLLGR